VLEEFSRKHSSLDFKSCDCTSDPIMPSRWALALLALWTAIVLSIPISSISHANSPRQSNNSAIAEPYLHRLAQAQGKLWFGTATNIYGSSEEQLNENYMTILNSSDVFGQLTPINQMKVSILFLALDESLD
jgi:hypothetical protein